MWHGCARAHTHAHTHTHTHTQTHTAGWIQGARRGRHGAGLGEVAGMHVEGIDTVQIQSYEEEDTCHMRRRIHVERIDTVQIESD